MVCCEVGWAAGIDNVGCQMLVAHRRQTNYRGTVDFRGTDRGGRGDGVLGCCTWGNGLSGALGDAEWGVSERFAPASC